MESWLFSPQIATSPPQLLDRARAAETAGFTGLALMDHLIAPGAEGYDTWEAMTLATWLLARTTTLRIGHLVLCDGFREPAVLAQQAVTLDHLSDGRFELGLGAGSWPRELEGFGLTTAPGARVDRLASSLAVVRDVLAGAPTAVHGLTQTPRPLGRIPLLVGGAGPRVRGLAATYADWWNLPAPDLHRLAELAPSVAPARISVQLAVVLLDHADDPDAARARVERRLPGLADGLVVGTADVVRARLRELAAAGVSRVYVWLALGADPAAVARYGALLLAA